MPIVVDKTERRAQVIDTAFRLVADQGIEGLTFREIAAAHGCSTSIVSHYFRGKDELLYEVYRRANAQSRERIDAAFARGASLLDCLCEILPIGPAAQANWRVWIAFWARAHLDPLWLEERRVAAEASLELYRAMLAGRATIADPMTAARRVIASVAGIGLEAIFAPTDWDEEQMRTVLAAQLADLGVDPHA